MTNAFPKDFIWGTATAAYQIEGGVDRDGRKPSIWDVFCKIPGAIERGDHGDIACNHYDKWQEDVEILANLGAPNYRFSVAWPRIIPNGTGQINLKGVDFYNRLIDRLLEKNINPWITMYHWDLPQALHEKGGWLNRDISGWFADYADVIVKSFGDRVKNWFIFNEPSCASYFGYGTGTHAPGLRGRSSYFGAAHNINCTIGHVYRQVKSSHPDLQLGSAFTLSPGYSCKTADPEPGDMAAAVWNWNHLDPILSGQYPQIFEKDFSPFIKDNDMKEMHVPLDYIGVQYYSPNYWERNSNSILGADFSTHPGGNNCTDIGWPINHHAFAQILEELHQRHPTTPIIISENGACFNTSPGLDNQVHDIERIHYLQKHLTAVQKAIEASVPIKGYFCWSFLDNFEWAFGYDKRFGLVHVDYNDQQKRTPKDSFYWLREVIKDNKMPPRQQKISY
jgi:beta-glucosidase